MPPGVPVATVAIGKAGATNAGVLAAQMIAIGDPVAAARLKVDKPELEAKGEASAVKPALVKRRISERALLRLP